MRYYLGVDLGGTKVAIGLVEKTGNLIGTREIPTLKDAEKLAKLIYEETLLLLADCGVVMSEIASLGIGVPGSVDKQKRVIIYANNLDFVKVPFVALLEQYFPVPIFMENDANVAAWAEYKAGVGKEKKEIQSFLLVTLGTGVGAGMIFQNQIFAGCNQGAGEIGHMVIDCKGIPCNCGRKGCYESYASTTALLEQAREAMSRHAGSLLWQQCANRPEQLNGKQFFEAVRKQDLLARRVLHQFLEYVAVGIINIINLLQPDYLVIGGGISKAGDLWIEDLRSMVKEKVYTRDDFVQTKIELAALGNGAGVIGAALLQAENR